MAEPVEPVAAPAATRWADPVETPQAAPLMEAEVVHPAIAASEDLTGNLFSSRGPYADSGGMRQPPLVAEPLPAAPPPARKRKKHAGGGGSKSFSDWVAYAVLFVLLPMSALFTVISLFQPAPNPNDFATQPGQNAPGTRSPRRTSAPPGPTTTANEPPPSGYPITLWNAAKRDSGAFSVEYRQDRGPLDSSHQYYWVVTDPSGKIEFPIPASVWKKRDKLSGKPAAPAFGQFMGPYTMFIEEQVGSSRNRISNDAQVVIGQ